MPFSLGVSFELSLDKIGEILFHVLRFNFFLVLREVDSKSVS
jgi:hypothetical protein